MTISTAYAHHSSAARPVIRGKKWSETPQDRKIRDVNALSRILTTTLLTDCARAP